MHLILRAQGMDVCMFVVIIMFADLITTHKQMIRRYFTEFMADFDLHQLQATMVCVCVCVMCHVVSISMPVSAR
jgi:hypothetical protein